MKLRNSASSFVLMLVAIAIAGLLSACDTMQLQKPVSLEDSVHYAQSQVSAAYRTIGDLKASQQITGAQGRKLFDATEKAEGFTNAADLAVSQGDTTTAAQKLGLAKTALLELQVQLRAAQQPKKE